MKLDKVKCAQGKDAIAGDGDRSVDVSQMMTELLSTERRKRSEMKVSTLQEHVEALLDEWGRFTAGI